MNTIFSLRQPDCLSTSVDPSHRPRQYGLTTSSTETLKEAESIRCGSYLFLLNTHVQSKGYSGTAGDSPDYHNGSRFTTRDNDNDVWYGNCAQYHNGAWWYHSCAYSNLNGRYFNTVTDNPQSINWHHWKGALISLKFSEMKTHRNN
uniref:Fibrinogen C-terminal domain-containing protein n=1 Tax=Amphimedon queenslandica TaxID=400682 RepID=A0A1X7TDD5_AMPQE